MHAFMHALYGGSDHVTMIGHVRSGQEWDIETSFRLRIIDSLSLWDVIFLTCGTQEYVEICKYP